jgi:hypothetical protein
MKALIGVLTASLVSSACVAELHELGRTSREERHFEVTGVPEVTLITFDGPVEVRAWDRPDVAVEIEKRADDEAALKTIDVSVEQNGDSIRVEARRPSGVDGFLGFGVHAGASVRLTASVPRRSNLLARTGDGAIAVERLAGRVELRTGEGSIRGIDLEGEIAAHTGDGSIRLDDIAGAVDLTTGDGSIVAEGRIAALRAQTGDGSVSVRATAGSAMADDWDITTADGAVVVELPGEFEADLDAHTGDGAIRSDASLETRVHGEIDRQNVRGRLGAGGKLLRIRSGDGSIHLRSSDES